MQEEQVRNTIPEEMVMMYTIKQITPMTKKDETNKKLWEIVWNGKVGQA